MVPQACKRDVGLIAEGNADRKAIYASLGGIVAVWHI
jgi:hypothetical protein